ncbi:hypothetical protein SAE02_72750 [Skermanella aerolata]|uniref:Phospholipase C/D domain-containing protein n=1 Tax=Skermanella aerolata TaxID=393310 RepID=A0A512E346_9PROT|nr:hypothetical protein N826_38830 [Skermanella aerolata KACC 11604]GEO43127.1 hypothetical protein SAE02_72750 [Skermanella aerolata]
MTLNGQAYPIPQDVAVAITSHPERYRIGSLGPDVFPDPVVGQTTTHPGLAGGWQTDDWLRNILGAADDPEERAFAYGFAAHAAGDVFAHTYVNAYAGDIFELTDGEVEVERRHFVLEKYIESLTPDMRDVAGNPIPWSSGFATATSFSRDTLILNPSVAGQYRKVSTAQHLAAMFDVRTAVEDADKLTQDAIGRITGFGADYFKKQLELQIDLATGKTALDAADLALKGHEELLEIRRAAYDEALRALNGARDIIRNYPELVSPHKALLAIQVKALSDATDALTKATADAARLGGGIQNEINKFNNRLGNLVCDTFLGFLDECNDLVNSITEAQNRLNVLNNAVVVADAAVKEAEKARDTTQNVINEIDKAHDAAIRGIADGVYQAAEAAAKAELDLQEAVVKEARKGVGEAQKVVERIQAELDGVGAIVDEIKRAVDKYNLITLFLRNWNSDINVASEQYIKSSHSAGMAMLLNAGNPIDEYWTWYKCYGQVFLAHPKELGQAGCLVREGIDKVREEYDRAIDSLPEILRWAIAPSREAQKLVMKRLEPELKKAEFALLAFLTDKTTADFLLLLSSPENATRSKLVEVFSNDTSGKNLLEFDDAADLVEKDMTISGGKLDPDRFAPLRHSVTLAKLSLLAPDQLNRLAENLSGVKGSPVYGAAIYPNNPGNFTLLYNMVRSIDGNHQWQAYGLPWPRKAGVEAAKPGKLNYGYDYNLDQSKGLRFWVDPFLRERVFQVLFPDGVIGALGDRRELQWPQYRFPACPQNPFPATQNIDGSIRSSDPTCAVVADAARPALRLEFTNRNSYQDRYFQCDRTQATAGESPYWTVVGSFTTKDGASRHAEANNTRFPDHLIEVWEPQNSNRYWTTMVAACTSKARAEEARDLAIRRSIATDAFIWSPRLPWKPQETSADTLASNR